MCGCNRLKPGLLSSGRAVANAGRPHAISRLFFNVHKAALRYQLRQDCYIWGLCGYDTTSALRVASLVRLVRPGVVGIDLRRADFRLCTIAHTGEKLLGQRLRGGQFLLQIFPLHGAVNRLE